MPATIDPARQFERARRALMRSDPRLARVIRASGARRPSFQVREPFRALVGAVVSQQLSTRAADTIQQRLEALVPTLSPTALDTVPDGALRTIGLSGQKVSYLRDLAARVTDGRLDLDHLSTLDDAAVTDAIVGSAWLRRVVCADVSDLRAASPRYLPHGRPGHRQRVPAGARDEVPPCCADDGAGCSALGPLSVDRQLVFVARHRASRIRLH